MKTNFCLVLFIVSTIFIGCDQSDAVNQKVDPRVEQEFSKSAQALRIDTLPAKNIRGTDWRYDAHGNPIIFGEWYIRKSETRKLFPVSHFDNGDLTKNFDGLSAWYESSSSNKSDRYDLFDTGGLILVDLADYSPMEESAIKVMLTGESKEVKIVDDTSIVLSATMYSR